jgi:hypothetical protein
VCFNFFCLIHTLKLERIENGRNTICFAVEKNMRVTIIIYALFVSPPYDTCTFLDRSDSFRYRFWKVNCLSIEALWNAFCTKFQIKGIVPRDEYFFEGL